jgi:hypothetical protein
VFWQTLGAILTGLAAIVTAAGTWRQTRSTQAHVEDVKRTLDQNNNHKEQP